MRASLKEPPSVEKRPKEVERLMAAVQAVLASLLALGLPLEDGRSLASDEELPPGALRRLRWFILDWYEGLDASELHIYDSVQTFLKILLIPAAFCCCAWCQSCLYDTAKTPYRKTMY